MTDFFFKKSPIVTTVGTGVGAALFFVVGRFVSIPSPIPNTSISLQYAVLALFAVLYGPLAGFLIGIVGHYLIDISSFGAWWSWILSSAVFGLVLGLLTLKLKLDKDNFKVQSIAWFIVALVATNGLCWILIAPTLDVLIYAEPANKVFVQGLTSFSANTVTSIIVGTILAVAYAKTVTSSNSLTESVDDEE
ncbi:ECF-type riboflavin transporter substrate-binding protein [Actinomyces sp. zg-332]|uniref:ECF-type riboflavin transporter substrate-binding protein n=1 Tax=Actinomyces sp. zg-332 TaxID=2708340 RepID=UPI00141FD589|nr:ECF-type riboflavin transporter substrate-binding protein [Actinomyces sp. zg-332]QPK93946.1 ECF-type riboflavin transporter substrate-binding protein [Actinomyces sp. zg-332]